MKKVAELQKSTHLFRPFAVNLWMAAFESLRTVRKNSTEGTRADNERYVNKN
jgi:hypothetical protein